MDSSCSASHELSADYSCDHVHDGERVAWGAGDDRGKAWATGQEQAGSWIELSFANTETVDSMRFANRDGGHLASLSCEVLEAEAADAHGPLFFDNHDGHSGTGFMDFQNHDGDYLEWTVEAPAAATAEVSWKYALTPGYARDLRLSVNGANEVIVAFPPSGGWADWHDTEKYPITLQPGSNAIRLAAFGHSGGNIDHMTLCAPSKPSAATGYVDLGGSCRDHRGANVLGSPAVAGDASPAACQAICDGMHQCDGFEWDPRREPPQQAMINGRACANVVIVGDGCVPGSPHFDPEGMVCANDGQADEAYCSYSIGANTCAYCSNAAAPRSKCYTFPAEGSASTDNPITQGGGSSADAG